MDEIEARRDGFYLRTVGSGLPVLILHAFPLNGRMWERQMESFRDRVRLVIPDLPGFGLSAPLRGEDSLDAVARRLLERLDALEIDRFVAVGASMGGYLAFRMLDLAPRRFLGLMLADTRAGADSPEQRAARHRLAAEVEAGGVDVAVDELVPRLLGETTLRTHPSRIDLVRALARESSPAGVAAALRAMAARPDSSSLLPSLTCPVVCVVGDEDRITPPAVVREMAVRIPRALTIVIPGAGHLPSLEAPDEFDRALESLLGAVGRPS